MMEVKMAKKYTIGADDGTRLHPNISYCSSTSLSSVDAPSDEERYSPQSIFKQARRSGDELRDLPSFNSIDRQHSPRGPTDRRLSIDSCGTYSQMQAANLYSIPKSTGAFSQSNSSVCRFRYEGVNNQEKIENADPGYKHHHRAGTLHSTSRIQKKSSLDVNDFDASDDRPTMSGVSFFDRNILSLKIKRNFLASSSKIMFLFVACIFFMNVSTDLHTSLSPVESTVRKDLPNVAYGVEHGREIEFPPLAKSQGKISLVSETIQEVTEDADILTQEASSNSLLKGSSKQVVDAPKYIPRNIVATPAFRRQKRKPIVSYAKMSSNSAIPKFIPEKFVLDESKPINNSHRNDSSFFHLGKLTIGLILGVSGVAIVSLFLILGSGVGNRETLCTQSRRDLNV